MSTEVLGVARLLRTQQPTLTRGDRATCRAESQRRFDRLLEVTTSGPQALMALGVFSWLWHHRAMTSAGFLAMDVAQIAELTGVDERTLRRALRQLGEAGFLEARPHGYQVPDVAAFEGVRTAKGTSGFARADRAAYCSTAGRFSAFARRRGRQGAYAMAALGAFEVLRLQFNWRRPLIRMSISAAARALGTGAKTYAGYIGLLEAAGLLKRTGSRIRAMNWDWLTFGSDRCRAAAQELRVAQDLPVSTTGEAQDLPDLSQDKSRSEITINPSPTSPHNDAARRTAGWRSRRGEHPSLERLVTRLEDTSLAAGQARWRTKVRKQLSSALEAVHGDVDRLAAALTKRDLSTAHDVPLVLGSRCAGAIGAVQAAHRAESETASARSANAQRVAAARETKDRIKRDADHLEVTGERWAAARAAAARELNFPPQGAPFYNARHDRVIDATLRERVARRLASSGPAAILSTEVLEIAVAHAMGHAQAGESSPQSL